MFMSNRERERQTFKDMRVRGREKQRVWQRRKGKPREDAELKITTLKVQLNLRE